MMKSQRTDTEKSNFIKEGERKGTDRIITQNECISIKQCYNIV